MKQEAVAENSGIGLALGLVFLSGFAALVYQVLWMKQIGLLFGNTSHAASVTLASFFAGLAAGSWVLGKRVSKASNPMRTYAWLEVAIAITALLYFVILAIYEAIYPSIYQVIGSSGWMLPIKFMLSLLLVFPPAFCMGGTIPVIGQYAVRERDAFGFTAALMYGINTLGAALGAFLAGFYLPLWIGFNATCMLAIVISMGIAFIAFRLAKKEHHVAIRPTDEIASKDTSEGADVQLTRQERRRLEREKKRGKAKQEIVEQNSQATPSVESRIPIVLLCFLSGFGVLALEVLWTRLFSQVLENSVYTFAAILVVVLLCLAVGALLSSQLAKLKAPPYVVLTFLVLGGALAITLTPLVFLASTDGMQIVLSTGSWASYIFLIFRTATLTIAPAAILLGTVFPYLMKLEEKHLESAGLSLGRLATANTVGAILGALLCGFIFLDVFGIWLTMQVLAVIYIVAALLLPLGWTKRSMIAKLSCFGMLLITLTAFRPGKLPRISVDPLAAEQTVVEIWEGSDCTVAVTDSRFGRAIRINSHYSLGSSGAYMQEKFQADLPLMIWPETESIFFLGVGTGITAGSALDARHAKVERIVACELVPEVITAAEKYFTDMNGFDLTGGLFKDPRATVLIEDGRHYLMATDQTFDMINADLFVPFRSGAGSLYTKEHFESARDRLEPDGVFVQWLPLYQLTENEFSVIAKTMIDVFDQVSLWRHNFQPGDEVVALVGRKSDVPLPTSEIDSLEDKLFAVSGKSHLDLQQLRLPLDPQTITLFYCGNLTEARSLFDEYAVNTDDRPVIEYMAPRTYRKSSVNKLGWFTREAFADFVREVQKICPPESDPLLVNRTPANRRLPLAGQAFHRARIAEVNQNAEKTVSFWNDFVEEWTDRKATSQD